MAVSRITPDGWLQTTQATRSLVTPAGWINETAAGGVAEPEPEQQPEPVAVSGWGGIVSRWPQSRRRTREEIDDERRRLGILPPKVAEVVIEVASEAAQQPAVSDSDVRDDLHRRLTEVHALYRTEYLTALYAEIEYQRLLQQAHEEEEESVAVLLMALVA